MTRARVAKAEPQSGACKSQRCRASIRWVKVDGGEWVPVDFTPDPSGTLLPVIVGGEKRMRWVRPSERVPRGQPRFSPHWTTCTQPEVWRALRQHTDRYGLSAIRVARGGTQGPCAGCCFPEHELYGLASQGMLCEVCVGILAAWRALPAAQRGPIPYPAWNPETGQRQPRNEGA